MTTALEIIASGPQRVIINGEGEATTSRRARVEHGIVPDVIFVRDDGWTLGARWEESFYAYGLWEKEWTHFLVRPETKLRPISTIHEYIDKLINKPL